MGTLSPVRLHVDLADRFGKVIAQQSKITVYGRLSPDQHIVKAGTGRLPQLKPRCGAQTPLHPVAHNSIANLFCDREPNPVAIGIAAGARLKHQAPLGRMGSTGRRQKIGHGIAVGEAVDGPMAGRMLEPVPAKVTFWFATVAFLSLFKIETIKKTKFKNSFQKLL